VKWLSRQAILSDYNLAEDSLDHLTDLELFIPEENKVVRGVRHFRIDPLQEDILQLGALHYSSMKNGKRPLFPYQKILVFYLLTIGPKQTYDILRNRLFITSERPTQTYLKNWLTEMVKRAPDKIKAWIKGEQTEPDDNNRMLVDNLLVLLDIEDLFEDPDLADLPLIYGNGVVRRSIESMLVTDAQYAQIRKVLERVHELDITLEDLKLYHRFYFEYDLLTPEELIKHVETYGATQYTALIKKSYNKSFNEYVRERRLPFLVETSDMLDDMISIEQHHYQKYATAGVSVEDSRKRTIAINNTLSLIEAKKAVQVDDGVSEMDRLMLEFEEAPPQEMKLLKREDMNPGEIDSKEVVQGAGMWTSAEEIEDGIKRDSGTGS